MDELDEEISEVLYQLFYTPSSPCAFTSPENLHREATKQFPSLSLNQVKQWLRSQYTYTLHRQAIDHFKRNKIVVDREGRQWQADLVDLKIFARRNKGYSYLLNCIDCFSRKAIVVPLKDKSASCVRDAFEKIFQTKGHPDFLQTDQGREFFGLKELLRAYGIKHFFATDQNIKCAIVERFNRTFRGRMFKLFTARGTSKYHDVLDDLVEGYNSSYHRSIGMAPNDVDKDTRERVFRRLYDGCKDIIEYYAKIERDSKRVEKRKSGDEGSRINVDDWVRIRHPKTTAFMQMYYPRWRDRIFKVKRINRTVAKKPRYKLEGDLGTESLRKRRGLYKEEIQKVDPDVHRVDRIIKRDPKKPGMVKVSWVDYPPEFNSWIPEAEMDRVSNLTTRR